MCANDSTELEAWSIKCYFAAVDPNTNPRDARLTILHGVTRMRLSKTGEQHRPKIIHWPMQCPISKGLCYARPNVISPQLATGEVEPLVGISLLIAACHNNAEL
jgi:hypothetical protein